MAGERVWALDSNDVEEELLAARVEDLGRRHRAMLGGGTDNPPLSDAVPRRFIEAGGNCRHGLVCKRGGSDVLGDSNQDSGLWDR